MFIALGGWRASSINTMTIPTFSYPTKQLLWVSDIHLDQAREEEKKRFMSQLTCTQYDAVLVTGDISTAAQLVGHLTEISHACGTRPVFFLTGNHDYFGSSFATVDQAVADLCARHRNLISLGGREIVELSPRTALVGHRGWGDGKAGAGEDSKVASPDRYAIDDFRSLNRVGYFTKLRSLGEESATYFRRVLPRALHRHRKVLIGTHFPLFTQAIKHRNTNCAWDRQPYYSNRSAGNAIVGISRNFPGRQIEVYAGHSHCFAEFSMSSNLEIRVAGARRGFPSFQSMITID
jgi:Icc protein